MGTQHACMTRRIRSSFPIFSLHKSPIWHRRQQTRRGEEGKKEGTSTQELLTATRGPGRLEGGSTEFYTGNRSIVLFYGAL